jgi:hypothetical protein
MTCYLNRRLAPWRRPAAVLLAFGLVGAAFGGQSVFILNIDGLRSNEGFEAGRTNMPFIWDSLRPLGTLYAQFYNTGVTITNSAHSTIVTGTPQLLYNNTAIETPIRPDEPTIGEYYRKGNGLPPGKAVFISGKATTWRYPASTLPGYGYVWAPSIVWNTSGDIATWDSLHSFAVRNHPSLSYTVFGQVDDVAHTGDWSNYLASIRRVDSLIFEVWRFLRSDSVYRDSTTLIVTSDHGRHDARHGGWWEHGCACHGCRHILFLALGPGIKADTVVSHRRFQADIAPTVGRLLNFNTPLAQGTVLTEMLRSSFLVHRSSFIVSPTSGLDDINLSNSPGMSRACDIALTPGNLHCVYTDNSDGAWRVMYARSNDRGAHWPVPQPLFSGSDDYTEPVLAALDSAALFAATLARRWSDADSTCFWVLCGRRSTDEGITWQPVFDIESLGMVSSRPAICASGARVGVAVLRTGLLVLRLSADRGATFGLTETLSGAIWHYPKSPAAAMLDTQSFVAWQALVPSFVPDSVNFHNIWLGSDQWNGHRRMLTRNQYTMFSYIPTLTASPSGVLHLAFADLPDARMGNSWRVAYIRGTARGDTWSVPVPLNGSEIGYAPAICRYDSGRLACAWAAFSDEQWHVAAAASADDGLTWSLPFEVSAPQDFSIAPRLIADHDTCFAVWQDCRSGNWEIRFTACPVPMTGIAGSAPQTSTRLAACPNPASGLVRIRYELKRPGPVRLVLLDVTGRMVAELVNESRTAGVHTASWSSGPAPAGVYFFRLETEGQSTYSQMELLH